MPVIKARTERVKASRFMTQMWDENLALLYAYAAMIGELPGYIVNELVAGLKNDPDYKKWRQDHPENFLPESTPRKAKRAKTADTPAYRRVS